MLPIHEFAKLKLGGIKKGNELDPRREFRIWLFDLGWLKKLDSAPVNFRLKALFLSAGA